MERVRRNGLTRKRRSVGSDRKVAVVTGDTDGLEPSKNAGWRRRSQGRIRKEPTMEGTTFVGLDVHKVSINVAALLPGRDTPLEWRILNEPQAIRKMLKRVAELSSGDVRYCYEAGPCGYALQRQIISWSEASCMLVAPSLIPRKPGERIKTDRRDAKKLALLFRAGLLTEVHPLTEEDEAARDLSRARDDLREDLTRARHRLSKFLLRRAINFTPGKKAWTLAHRHWLESLHFDNSADWAVFTDYLLRSSTSSSVSRASSCTSNASARIRATRRPSPRCDASAASTRSAPSATRWISTTSSASPAHGASCPSSDSSRESTAPARGGARAPSPRPATATSGAC